MEALFGAPICFAIGFLWGKLSERRRWKAASQSQMYRERYLQGDL